MSDLGDAVSLAINEHLQASWSPETYALWVEFTRIADEHGECLAEAWLKTQR